MAQYKVPQDVEADDKLLGPFNFRQFVYLMVAAALIALAVGLFQLFPLLAILPLPIAAFLLILALPLKKDQPMETYVAAMVSYYTSPRTRVWMTGQGGTPIQIMAPKKVEESRTREITGEEATHRLSFLADIVDTEGYAIKGISMSGVQMREDLVAEASTAVDMFEGARFDDLASTIEKDENKRHQEVMRQMQAAIDETEAQERSEGAAQGSGRGNESEGGQSGGQGTGQGTNREYNQERKSEPQAVEQMKENPLVKGMRPTNVVVMPDAPEENMRRPVRKVEERYEGPVKLEGDADESKKVEEKEVTTEKKTGKTTNGSQEEKAVEKSDATKTGAKTVEKQATRTPKPSIIELANNEAFSVATIAEQAKRVNEKEESEVFISLH